MGHVGRLTKASRWAAYKHLREYGPQTAKQIADCINNRSGTIKGRKTKWSVTSHQLAQAMRLSPMFRSTSHTPTSVTRGGRAGKSNIVKLWEYVPVAEVREKTLGKPESLRRLPSHMRKLMENENND